MSEYTEGPWRARLGAESDIFDYTITNAEEHDIAACNGWDKDLIAAALDMYEALRRAQMFIKNGVEGGYISMPDADCPDPAHDTLPVIDAALSKARGES